MRDHFVKRLSVLAKSDPRIILLTGDLGFGVLSDFQRDFPRQYINVGVAEQNMTGLATGLALEGRIAFTYSIANFPTLRCLEQIRNDACYHGANVKIVAIGGGFSYGALGISHHATEDLAILRALPDMTVVSPCGLWETMEATTAIVNHSGCCYLRLDKSAGNDAPSLDGEVFHIGKARRLQPGTDCSIFVTGGILEEVLSARTLLLASGISAEVISMHTLKPIDADAITAACMRTGRVVTVEEHNRSGGLGSAVGEVLLDRQLQPRRFLRIALDDRFSCIVGSQQYLRKRYALDAESIAARIRRDVINHRQEGVSS